MRCIFKFQWFFIIYMYFFFVGFLISRWFFFRGYLEIQGFFCCGFIVYILWFFGWSLSQGKGKSMGGVIGLGGGVYYFVLWLRVIIRSFLIVGRWERWFSGAIRQRGIWGWEFSQLRVRNGRWVYRQMVRFGCILRQSQWDFLMDEGRGR